jgi:Zn-finger nucleic acid-binding protein
MKARVTESSSVNELQFELKYCERCGGLWLRPVGGGQIYCVACGRAMGELPPASRKAETARMPQGPRWGMDDSDFEDCEEYGGLDLDAAGGVV